jgi:hypothetical protein
MKLRKTYVFLAGAIFAAAAYAAPPYSYRFHYFSDDTYTTRVGGGTFDCGGNWWRTGIETEYYTEDDHNKCRYGGWDISPWE